MPHPEPFDYKLLSAPQQPAKKLIVVFHGHGGDAASFVPTGEAMQKAMPDADVICLEGPVKLQLPQEDIFDSRTEGRTWMKFESIADLAKMSLKLIFNRVDVIRDVNRFIDAELKKRNLTDKDLGLFGFSMGAGVALVTAQSRPNKCAGVVSHSGVYLRYPYIKSRPETLMIMGDWDYLYEKTPAAKGIKGFLTRIFSYQHDMTKERLTKLGMPLKEVIIPFLQHNLSDESEAIAAQFLKEKLTLA